MQMSPLTYWHYLLLTALGIIFILGAVLAFRSAYKWSILATVIAVLAGVGISLWALINQSIYHVEISQLNDQHVYQTEQIIITGIVRNTGDFPVANVVGIVKLINSRDTGDRKGHKQFAQPTAFAEIYKGDDPRYKPQNIVFKREIADYLNPGSAKSFTIILDYPPYFKNASYEVDASVY